MQQVQAMQHERAAVAAREFGQRHAQRGTGGGDQRQRHRSGTEAVPGAQVQERAADEAITGTEQLQHADLFAAGLDIQAHAPVPAVPRTPARHPGAGATARRAAPDRPRAGFPARAPGAHRPCPGPG
ncbi:hypothetical protein G6F68_016440 [Rhizopus microsporus]|nr:hypothetical protein G6F68_016440 [Rhizopus microsporus]